MTRGRVKFKQQVADSDCGAACLSMLLEHYGHSVSVYRTRLAIEEFGPPESTKSIIKAARSFGLNSQLIAADLNQLENVRTPCILFWKFTHFVVLTQIGNDRYYVADPAIGKRRVSTSEFQKSYTGIAIQASPGPDFTKAAKVPNWRFRQFLKRTVWRRPFVRALCGLLLAAFFLQSLSLLAPLLTAYFIDIVLPTNESALMWPLLAVVALLALNIAIIALLRARIILELQNQTDKAMLGGFFGHVIRLPIGFFSERSAGDIQSRMNSNTMLREAFSSYTLGAILDSIMVLIYLGVLGFFSVTFMLVTIGIGIAHLCVYYVFSRALRDHVAVEVRAQARYQGSMFEVLQSIFLIKGCSVESEIENRWSRKLSNYLIAARDRGVVDARMAALTQAINVSAPALLLWTSIWLYFGGHLSLGTVLALNAIAGMAIGPLTSLVTVIRNLQLFSAHAQRIGEVWEHEPISDGDRECPNLSMAGSIALCNVTFRYRSSRENALNDISIDIPLGKKTALVGPSGCGKSTLIAVILGFYIPEDGEIRVLGESLSTLNIRSYRRQIGYVPQDSTLLNGSVRGNLSLLAPEATLQELKEAAELAGVLADIEKLPMGIDGLLGESGASLSGGQRQRLCIARALARRPKVLILDEATSSLDSVTEARVSQAVSELNCTQIVVSHRISTVKDADKIVIMKAGEVFDQGSHAELLDRCQYYRDCVNAQFDNASTQSAEERKLRGSCTESQVG